MKSVATLVSFLLLAGSLSAGLLPGDSKPTLPGSGGSGPVLPPGSGGTPLPGGGTSSGGVLPSPPKATGGGDAFVSATRLSGSSVSDTGSNVNATRQIGEPIHGGYAGNPGGKSMWWRWTSSSDGTLIVSTEGSSFDTVVGVYTGTEVSALTALSYDDNSGSGQTGRASVRVFPDTVYYIAVDGYNGASGTIKLSLSVNQTILSSNGLPVNDDFENRQVVVGAFTTTYGTNENATVQAGEVQLTGAAFLVGQSVWYSWTAPATGTVTIDTVGSNYDTSLTVYTGATYNALVPVFGGQDDDGADTALDSKLELAVTKGVTYHIAVDGYSGNITGRSAGSFILNVKLAPDSERPLNDEFEFRTGIQGNAYTVSATNEDASDAATVWWTWTAPSVEGTVSLVATATEESTLSPAISVYTGASVDSLVLVTSAADGDSSTPVSFITQPGVTYQIAVNGDTPAEGDFNFSLTYADGRPAFASQPMSQNAVVGADAVFNAPATVATLNPKVYQWQRKVGSNWVNLSTNATYLGTNTDTLTVKAVTLAMTNTLFRCQVYNVIGSATSSQVTLTVVPNPPVNQGASVNMKTGSTQNISVASANPGITVKYFATGLPQGLKINPTTGQITGIVKAKAGSYTVKYWTQSGNVKSAVQTTIFVVPLFPAALSGEFEALLTNGVDELPVGKLHVTISNPGVYTASFTSGALAVTALKGSLVLDAADAFATASVAVKRNGFAASQLTFTVLANGTITGTLKEGSTTIGTIDSGVRVATTSINWAGNYTLAFGAPTLINAEARPIPSGSGYASAKVSTTGVLTLTGKNADGTPLTASLNSAADASYRLYSKPVTTVTGAYVAGWLQFTPRVSQTSVYQGTEANNMDLYWNLPASTKNTNYKAGFGPLGLSARMERWANLFAPFQVNLTDDGLFGVDISGPGVTNAAPNTNQLPETLKVLVGGQIALNTPNLSGWSLSVNTATGVFTGNFTVTDTLVRKVPFSGVLLQLPAGDPDGVFGQGYFLVPSVVKNGPTLSGTIEFVAPPVIP